jgi:hypothetical protein
MPDTQQPSTALVTALETTPAAFAALDKYARSAGQHSDRKRGTIFNPVLTGIDWVHASRVTDKVAPDPEPQLSSKTTVPPRRRSTATARQFNWRTRLAN